jgi:hypothetical protein
MSFFENYKTSWTLRISAFHNLQTLNQRNSINFYGYESWDSSLDITKVNYITKRQSLISRFFTLINFFCAIEHFQDIRIPLSVRQWCITGRKGLWVYGYQSGGIVFYGVQCAYEYSAHLNFTAIFGRKIKICFWSFLGK